MTGLTVTKTVHFATRSRGRRVLREGEASLVESRGQGVVPRVSRLMALAIRFEGLIEQGAVADQAELARLAFVSRARMTQIMNMTLLAPMIQDELLHLPRTLAGRDAITESMIRPVVREVDWEKQCAMWSSLVDKASNTRQVCDTNPTAN